AVGILRQLGTGRDELGGQLVEYGLRVRVGPRRLDANGQLGGGAGAGQRVAYRGHRVLFGAGQGDDRDTGALELSVDQTRGDLFEEELLVLLVGLVLGELLAQVAVLFAQRRRLVGQCVVHRLAERACAEHDARGQREEHGDDGDQVISKVDHVRTALAARSRNGPTTNRRCRDKPGPSAWSTAPPPPPRC